jgi:putative ABC transport system permease protein
MRVDRARLAGRMVRRRALSTLLASLGLGVVLAAAIVAVSIADEGRGRALAEIRSIGANILTVSAEASRNRAGRTRTNETVTTLSLLDARAVEQQVDHVSLVTAEYRSTIPVKAGDLARQVVISGSEPAYGQLRESSMRAGRFFDQGDDAEGGRVAVLGGRIASALFGSVSPVGRDIRLRGIPFTVIGVFAERGTGLDAFDEDEVIFVPLKTARRRLFPAAYVQRLFVRVGEPEQLTQTGAAIRALLAARHHQSVSESPDFRVQDQHRLVTLRETAVHRLGAFKLEVSAALLATGVFGIFSLQLLSVRERRAEIGTRRALGATQSMIFTQFLLEAAVVCLVGGLLGLGLGGAATVVEGVRLPLTFTLAATAACCAFGAAASIWPALVAARMHPSIALRG